MPGTTLGELALLRIMQKSIPDATPKHARVLLCIIRQKNNYLSLKEIEQESLVQDHELEKVMSGLSKNNLVQKEGCLFKKPVGEKIVEMI